MLYCFTLIFIHHDLQGGLCMPKITEQIDLHVPLNTIWDFIHVIDNWASLVPGYICHNTRSNESVELEFKVQVGLLKKKIKLYIDLTDYTESNTMNFQFRSESNQFTGTGTVHFHQLSPVKTRMAIHAEIITKGAMAPIINTFITNTRPNNTDEISALLEERVNDMQWTSRNQSNDNRTIAH